MDGNQTCTEILLDGDYSITITALLNPHVFLALAVCGDTALLCITFSNKLVCIFTTDVYQIKLKIDFIRLSLQL
jgi:hypothetical protein